LNLIRANKKKSDKKTFDEMLKKKRRGKGEVVEKSERKLSMKKPEMNHHNYDEAIASSIKNILKETSRSKCLRTCIKKILRKYL